MKSDEDFNSKLKMFLGEKQKYFLDFYKHARLFLRLISPVWIEIKYF